MKNKEIETTINKHRWWHHRVTAIPFLIGACLPSFWAGNWEFPASATLVMGVLVVTKNIDLW